MKIERWPPKKITFTMFKLSLGLYVKAKNVDWVNLDRIMFSMKGMGSM